MFFYKALLREKDARIADLIKQIEDMRSMVYPSSMPKGIPYVQLEADAIISGKEETIALTPEEIRQAEEEIAERDSLLSGTYNTLNV